MAHSHEHKTDNRTRLLWAIVLTSGFLLAEVIGGIISGSLALIADAGHMLTDAASLLLAWLALRASSNLGRSVWFSQRRDRALTSIAEYRFSMRTTSFRGDACITNS